MDHCSSEAPQQASCGEDAEKKEACCDGNKDVRPAAPFEPSHALMCCESLLKNTTFKCLSETQVEHFIDIFVHEAGHALALFKMAMDLPGERRERAGTIMRSLFEKKDMKRILNKGKQTLGRITRQLQIVQSDKNCTGVALKYLLVATAEDANV